MSFTAGLDNVLFYSQGSKLIGGFYRAAGETPRPTLILLHGIPGVEKNLDIAYALRDAGWNSLYFHYRGSWGSEGAYTFGGQLADVQAATEWVLQHPAVDPERLALGGSSLGGYMTFIAGAADSRFKALVPLCPLIDPPGMGEVPAELFEDFAALLNTTGPDLQAEWPAVRPVRDYKDQLSQQPILMVTGDQDESFSPEHYEPFIAEMPPIQWQRLAAGDHSFSACRKPLVDLVVGWLIEQLGQ